MDKKGEKVPTDWVSFPKHSEILIADKFIVSKTPLSDSYDSQLWDDSKYKPIDLLNYVKETFNKKVGLWIDLTTSDRFFSKEEVASHGVQFEKISCPSYFPFPAKDKVRQFCKIADTFFIKNRKGVIAVNCLDGRSVSGFYIISYLITNLHYPIGRALGVFKSARPPGIDEEFVDAINDRYQTESNVRQRNRNSKRKFESFNNNFVDYKDEENLIENPPAGVRKISTDVKFDLKKEKIKMEDDILSLTHALQDYEVNGFLEVVRRSSSFRPHNISFDQKKNQELINPVMKTETHVQIYFNGIMEDGSQKIPYYLCIYYDGGFQEDPVIRIFDSLNKIKNRGDLRLEFEDYLRALFPFFHIYQYPEIRLPEKNPIDCGYYACAFLSSICLGRNPEMEYYFHENLRPNLKNIIENKEFTPFSSNYQTNASALLPVAFEATESVEPKVVEKKVELKTIRYGEPSTSDTSDILIPKPMVIDVKPVINKEVIRETSKQPERRPILPAERSMPTERSIAAERPIQAERSIAERPLQVERPANTNRNPISDLGRILFLLKDKLELVKPLKKSELKKQVNKFMYNWSFDEFPGTIPTILTRENMCKLKDKKYCVSRKADGIRFLMYIVKKDEIYLIDRNNDYYKVEKGLHMPKAKSLNLHLENTLIDGEMVIDSKGKEELRYLIFDVILYDNVFMRDTKFLTDAKEQHRHQCMRMAIAKSFDQTVKEKKFNSNPPFLIYYKVFHPELSRASAILKEEFPHCIDGLIFLANERPYQPGLDEQQFMWMPYYYRNTIDFLCRDGKLFLRLEDSDDSELVEYAPFRSSRCPGNVNAVIECYFKSGEWVFLRKRPDKKIPNWIKRVDDVLTLAESPITKEELFEFLNSSETMQ